mgnify:CR=1 FL=1
MKKNRLKKELGLFGVFAMSTGAMFSSGFFLLPGLASQYTGASVFLAYLLSGLLIVPAMLSIAEISTALPKAGGAYFIIDRAYGPLLGTLGGIGTYFALVLKSAFALIGIGAYTTLMFEMPIKTIAIVLTLFFAIINVFGSKKSSFLQGGLVILLISVLGLLIIDGLFHFFADHKISHIVDTKFTPFLNHGLKGLFTTIGFVFVSYAGLTKIASVAEEIKNPDRNIPLGMMLSLIVTITIYVLGTFLMVSFINKDVLANDLAPVATLVNYTLNWMPSRLALILVIASAVAAFASTGNAGLMSSSRYPLAMARDKLLPPVFGKLEHNTQMPVFSIIITALIMILIIIFVSAEGIAKMASTFQLLIFFFINFGVIVFRNSKIEAYDPGFYSPMYPCIQLFGMISSFMLIILMGWAPLLLSAGLILLSLIWYKYYVKKRVLREGAIYHWFAILGQKQYDKIENEFLHIIKEKGLREGDQFDWLIINADISIMNNGSIHKKNKPFEKLIKRVSERIAKKTGVLAKELSYEFHKDRTIDPEFAIPNVSISYATNNKINQPEAYIVINKKGIKKITSHHGIKSEDTIYISFFVVAPSNDHKLLLRILSRLLDITERENFINDVISKQTAREIKEFLLHDERFMNIKLVSTNSACNKFIGKKIKDIDFPSGALIAIIERNNESFTPNGNTELFENDILTVIGSPEKLKNLRRKLLI